MNNKDVFGIHGKLSVIAAWGFIAALVTVGIVAMTTDNTEPVVFGVMTVYNFLICIIAAAVLIMLAVLAYDMAIFTRLQNGKMIKPVADMIDGYAIRSVFALLTVIAVSGCGKYLSGYINIGLRNVLIAVSAVFLAIVIVLLIINPPMHKKFRAAKENNVREQRDLFWERREQAINELPKAIARITNLRRICGIYWSFLFFAAIVIAFTAAVVTKGFITVICEIIPLVLLFWLYIRIKRFKQVIDHSNCSKESEFPYIYSLAHKAAKALGQDRDIYITFVPDCNAMILTTGKNHHLNIGVELLALLNENEFYQILIHEFAHRTKDGNPTDREFKHFVKIDMLAHTIATRWINILFRYADEVYGFEYSIYRAAASIAIETIADSAVLTHGNPQHAANANAKIALHSLFESECDILIKEHYFEPTEMRKNLTSKMIREFRTALETRKDFWLGILENEIQPRDSSHPIFRERVKAIGIEKYEIAPFDESGGEYHSETKKAISIVDERLYNDNKDDYTQKREQLYITPCNKIEKWKRSGGELVAEESRPIIETLMSLTRYEEAEELCDRIIAETENRYATAHAYRTKGILLLKRYDKSGIDLLYTAAEINENYIPECLNIIGLYCCRNGLQKELDEYREKAVELSEKAVERNAALNVFDTQKGEIVADDMPKEMLDGMIDFFKTIKEDGIDRIYLIQKRFNGEFATSAVVLRFKPALDMKTAQEIYMKIFDFLDAHPSGRQFSLFVYDENTAKLVNSVENSCIYDAAFDK